MKVSIEMDRNIDSKAMEQIEKAFFARETVFLKIYEHEFALTIMPEVYENIEFDGTSKIHCELSTINI